MTAAEGPVPAADRGDVLRLLRSGTAAEHDAVERGLDLLSPTLDRSRLAEVLRRLHGFWLAAEEGLDAWAAAHPQDAETVAWSRRRRADLYAGDLTALGEPVARTARPVLAPVTGTDEALGRLYVLEGSTLGGTVIGRHLATLPDLAGVRVSAFTPYGPDTGAMWHAFRRATRARVAADGDATTVVDAARRTFRALAAWCEPLAPAGAPA